jgi:hypothetical protein
MSLLRYNAFTGPDMAKTKITVDAETMTYTTYNREGDVTTNVTKNIERDQYEALVAAFDDFDQVPTTVEPEANVADVGEGNITFDGRTVNVDPYAELPQPLRDIDEQFNALQRSMMEMTDDEAEQLARDWIKQVPTYAYDGQDLELVDHTVRESYLRQHVLTYNFTSTHGGYGNRTGEMVNQVLTPHQIVVEVAHHDIQSAIIDDTWDARRQAPINGGNGGTTELYYQPMQCESAPWQDWYADNKAQFAQEPSDTDLIQAYYGERDVELETVSAYQHEGAVCQACNTCPTGSYYVADVSDGVDTMTAEGWTEEQTR